MIFLEEYNFNIFTQLNFNFYWNTLCSVLCCLKVYMFAICIQKYRKYKENIIG